MSTPLALSFSRVSDFQQCPHKFEAKYILKDYPDDSDNPAFAKGQEVHKQLENYVLHKRGDIETAPTMGNIAKTILPMLDSLWKLCNGHVFPEKQIAVNHDWEPCSWFDKPHVVKFRVIIDLLAFTSPVKLLAGDYKTGKVRDYEDGELTQLRLTAVTLFQLYPKIEEITCVYWYVEHKKSVPVTFKRDDLEGMIGPWEDIYDHINSVTEFEPKKNKYCNWCLLDRCPIKG